MGDKSTRHGGYDPYTGQALERKRKLTGFGIIQPGAKPEFDKPKPAPKPPKVEKPDPVTQTPEWQARQVKIDSAKMSNRITRRAKKYLGG